MKEIYYVYNNEAISSCIFLSILNKIDKLDTARSCLILPFLLDDRITNYLVKNNKISLEELIQEQPKLFVSFNKRFQSLLPVAINSLILLNKSNQIIIEKDISLTKTINFQEEDMGERFRKINSIIPKFLLIIQEHKTEQLYKLLNIQL